MLSKRFLCCRSLLWLGVVAACKAPAPLPMRTPVLQPPVVVAPPILKIPIDTAHDLFRGLHHRAAVVDFYRGRYQALAWGGTGIRTLLADSMAAVVANARYRGLLRENYHYHALHTLAARTDTTAIQRRDVLLTDAFFTLTKDLRYGRMAPVPVADTLAATMLARVAAGAGLHPALQALDPPCPGFRRLQQALATLLDTAAADVRDQLIGGTLHGSLPAAITVRTIEINLERWRQQCRRAKPARYIVVNIPSFLLHVIDHDTIVFESNVITGAIKTPTPELESVVDCVVIYPYWHVPRKIAVEEYLPHIRRDTSFLVRNQMEVLDRHGRILNPDSVAWNTFNAKYFPVSLRQREGEENSLGIVKFVFDNPYAVYLHDTNARRLFRSRMRALSHGCIRMEKALPLAHYLVTGNQQSTSRVVARAVEQKQRRTISLAQPVPIRIRYLTCDVQNGTLMEYTDVYGKDSAIAAALYAPFGVEE